MARCYNCGIQIPDGDRTRLCEGCKKIMFPFMKFVDASTSPAVKRLMSNERNLRNAGVTDSGMDYLLKLCEKHDAKREENKKAQVRVPETHSAAQDDDVAETFSSGGEQVFEPANEPPYRPVREIEQPVTSPEPVWHEPAVPSQAPRGRSISGGALTACGIILFACSAAMLIWLIFSAFSGRGVDPVPAIAALGFAFAGAAAVSGGRLAREISDIIEEEKRKH